MGYNSSKIQELYLLAGRGKFKDLFTWKHLVIPRVCTETAAWLTGISGEHTRGMKRYLGQAACVCACVLYRVYRSSHKRGRRFGCQLKQNQAKPPTSLWALVNDNNRSIIYHNSWTETEVTKRKNAQGN